uniref:NADH-ubiquinone oxidoreductase chain 2 n=1 Tax=Rhipicentor nuttalli TaxID=72856 RepID=A0A3G2JZV2_9ACAR|nr:NADH dehydrogenase subunit 2 [Rhipicentor nuttalli]AYN50572.1 NADH dehydrogenase subunit 2 [Rhipicentor nuttalli]
MFFNKIMLWFIMMTIILASSSDSWFIYWLSMEMNLMAFIPMMNNYKINNSNAMITYFIMQSFSSSLFFISAFQFYLNESLFFLHIMNISLGIKLAIFPFHFWLMTISEMLNFNNLMIILTLQKMIPLIIFSKIMTNSMLTLVLFSTFFSSFLAINHKLIKKLLILSSISHQGWMLCMIFKKINFWISYLLIYSMIIFSIINTCKKLKLNFLHKMLLMKMNMKLKLNMIMAMMSLGGMPPFLGFFMKTISIYLLIKMDLMLMSILILSSLINLFFYFQMLSPILFQNFKTLKNLKFNFSKKKFFFKLNLILLIYLMNMYLI